MLDQIRRTASACELASWCDDAIKGTKGWVSLTNKSSMSNSYSITCALLHCSTFSIVTLLNFYRPCVCVGSSPSTRCDLASMVTVQVDQQLSHDIRECRPSVKLAPTVRKRYNLSPIRIFLKVKLQIKSIGFPQHIFKHNSVVMLIRPSPQPRIKEVQRVSRCIPRQNLRIEEQVPQNIDAALTLYNREPQHIRRQRFRHAQEHCQRSNRVLIPLSHCLLDALLRRLSTQAACPVDLAVQRHEDIQQRRLVLCPRPAQKFLRNEEALCETQIWDFGELERPQAIEFSDAGDFDAGVCPCFAAQIDHGGVCVVHVFEEEGKGEEAAVEQIGL
ncbi:hypothetical protein HBI23_091880 [Parastagonospora nodorum]|nr:hypothetical protein HBI79_171770 [Parastagonospora nodorum]KAH5435127.1 hypothetical protein HBI47_084550 [Parastagonospora nodorum]KAH5663064.1 hypothetical protein HBI23_091880 [Parastagonospora nodorum]